MKHAKPLSRLIPGLPIASVGVGIILYKTVTDGIIRDDWASVATGSLGVTIGLAIAYGLALLIFPSFRPSRQNQTAPVRDGTSVTVNGSTVTVNGQTIDISDKSTHTQTIHDNGSTVHINVTNKNTKKYS